MNDDYSNDIFTSGVITIDGLPTPGVNEITSDDDWFRVELRKYYSYEFGISTNPNAAMPATELLVRVMDGGGLISQEFHSNFLPRTVRYQAIGEWSSYFVSVRHGDGAYLLAARLVDDYFGPNNGHFITESEVAFGAIETVGDEDPHVVQLLKDYTYTINVYGTDTSDATLADPKLQLFQKNGTLIGSDDNSGEGLNARFTFTPGFTDFFTVNISSADEGAGSYILDIPELDDFEADPTTTGVLEIGRAASGTIFWNSEQDWFRTTLDRYFKYEFTTDVDPNAPVQNRPSIQIFDLAGNLVSNNTPHFPSTEQFTAPYNGDFFVSATGGFGGYLLNGQIIDDYPDVTRTNYSIQQRLTGAIENVGDQDGFQVPLAMGVTYEINLVGQDLAGNTLADPLLEMYTKRGGALLASDNDSGVGSNAKLFFTPTENELFQIGVSGHNQTTGSYAVSLRAIDDFAGNPSTTSFLTIDEGVAQAQGALEFAHDIDWHAINMIENRRYTVFSHVDELGIRDTNNDYHSDFFVNLNTIGFQAEATGRHHIVTRREVDNHPQPIAYEVIVEEIPPRLSVQPMPQLIDTNPVIKNFVELNTGFSLGDRFEVYSTNWLEFEGQSIAPNQLLTDLSLGEFFHTGVSSDFVGQSQIWVRGKPKGYDDWSNWKSIPVYGRQFIRELHRQSAQTPVYFTFATKLPDYYGSETSYQGEFTAAEQAIIRDAIRYWDEALGLEFIERAEGSGNGTTNMEMMIFKSDLGGQHVAGDQPGVFRGFDLRINPFSPVMNGPWEEGSQAFYEVLRGVGSSLGLGHTRSLNRTQSLMGLRSDSDSWFLPYPSRPLPQDTFNIEYVLFEGFGIDANLDDTVYNMTGDPFFQTIFDGLGNDTIDASGQNQQTHIDLRPGATSFVGGAFDRPYNYVNSDYAFLENAIGGPLKDVLIGSNLGIANRLEGRDGHDFLMGMQGNDWLFGGRHNDTYFVQMNHGHDNIDEQNLDGFDRVIIDGMHNFDSLTNDLLFQRLGNDLLIKIDLDRLGDEHSDTIRIHNMGLGQSRVERLDLRNTDFHINGSWVAHVSLPSIFSQANDSFQRFELAAGFDQYGQMVSPL